MCLSFCYLAPGHIRLNGERIINKPSVGITIAVWVYVDSNEGQQELFQTIDPYADQNKHGQFYMELSDGQIRWFHRNSKGEVCILLDLIVLKLKDDNPYNYS